MSHPLYCIACISKESIDNVQRSKNPLRWENNFSSEAYDFEIDGTISVYNCIHEDCNAIYDIINLHLPTSDIRVIRYSYLSDDIDFVVSEKNLISNCLYCSDSLFKISQNYSSNIKTPIYKCNGFETLLKCPNCDVKYNVIDYLSLDDETPISRDIFLS